MKFVTEVRVGDKVRVEGYCQHYVRDDVEPEALYGQLAIVTGKHKNWLSLSAGEWAFPKLRVHLRNVTEIVECAPGAHVLARREMGSWLLTCSRCTSYKPEPVCWCGSLELGHMASMNMKHPFQPERRKEGRDRRK